MLCLNLSIVKMALIISQKLGVCRETGRVKLNTVTHIKININSKHRVIIISMCRSMFYVTFISA